jgi:hypothetical protein
MSRKQTDLLDDLDRLAVPTERPIRVDRELLRRPELGEALSRLGISEGGDVERTRAVLYDGGPHRLARICGAIRGLGPATSSRFDNSHFMQLAGLLWEAAATQWSVGDRLTPSERRALERGRVRLNLWVDGQLVQDLKEKSAAEGRKLVHVVTSLLRKGLSEGKEA